MATASICRTGFARRLREVARAALDDVAMLAVGFLLSGSMASPTQSPEPETALERLLYADAEPHLSDADPIVRGEAALTLASGRDPHVYPALLRVAKDAHPDARLRGILALSFLGAPGTAQFLASVLNDREARTESAGLAAAYALARLPADQSASVLAYQLSRLSESSYKRQRDVLLALLAGLLQRDPTDQCAPLQRLLNDASQKDPRSRSALLTALGPIGTAATQPWIESSLASRSPELRLAALSALSFPPGAEDSFAAAAVRLCGHDPEPRVRTAALAHLTRMRHLPALDLSATALRSIDAGEVAQAVRTAIQLGGNPMRHTLERQFEYLEPHAQRAVLQALSSLDNSISDEFADTCRALTFDATRPADLRAAAALLLCKHADQAPTAALDTAFASVHDPRTLTDLARARSANGGAHELLRFVVLPCKLDEEQLQTDRLTALLRADSSHASRRCIEWLREEDLGRSRAVVLRALRQSRLPTQTEPSRDFVPAALRLVLH